MNTLLVKIASMNKWMLWLHGQKTYALIGIVVAFNLILSLSVSFISESAGRSVNENFLPFDNIREEFIVVVIIAPFLETTLYQYFLIEAVLYLSGLVFKKESILLALLIPAVCFGLSHSYNTIYMINALLAGISLNSFYVLIRSKGKNAFIYTVIVHALYNLSVFILRQ